MERLWHIQSGILQPQLPQICEGKSPLRSRQDLWIGGAALRSKNTEPHLCNLRLAGPKAQKFFEVTGALCHLRRDRTVNGYSGPVDVLEDALVGARFAPNVVLGPQAID
jgi:hypothetical protein